MANDETVLTYEHNGHTYEIDHLGLGVDSQWGSFAVYRDDVMVAEVVADQWGTRPEYRGDLPERDVLIAMAKSTVADADRDYH